MQEADAGRAGAAAMRAARLLAAAFALPAVLGGAMAAAEEYQYPPWVADAQEAAGACLQQIFAGDDCRSGGWQFSKWDTNILRQPARAAITVMQGISEEHPRKGMTYIVERTGREIAFCDGSPRNIKITTPDDIVIARMYLEQEQSYEMNRIGYGNDLHRLTEASAAYNRRRRDRIPVWTPKAIRTPTH